MHELAVCQSLLQEVERTAAVHGAGQVVGITLAIGALSGVEAPLLARAFEIARGGTIASEAALEVEQIPVVVWCEACGVETPVAPNALLCGGCGSWKVSLQSGDELLLKQVELARVECPGACA